MRAFLYLALVASLQGGPSGPDKIEKLDSVVVSASRAGEYTPVTYTSVGREQLQSVNPMNSLPQALELQPGVVVSSEGGTGLGYTKMTVRGSKGSQINVTLNGITLNDGESQEVFWVNIPSLASILSSVQVQRGLGTTAGGPGSFGASINMSTASPGGSPSVYSSISYGSWNTMVLTAAGSTGLLPSGFYMNVAWTMNGTEGYIRNGWVDAASIFANAGWMKGDNSVRLTYLFGEQHSGITWTGTPLSYLETDRRYNPEGLYTDDKGVTKYYRNHSDNYRQQHLQLNYTHQFSPFLAWATTVNWTGGYGYNERFKAKKKFSAYGFPSDWTFGGVGASDKGDVVFRKTMDNGLWVLSSELVYKSPVLSLTGGAYASRYSGDHYGEFIWSSLLGDSFDYKALNAASPANNWYFNNGRKWDVNAFARGEWRITPWLNAYLDVQYRMVTLDMKGVDDEDDLSLDYSKVWHFVNPHAGLSAIFGGHKVYASVALGHREPSRADIKEVVESNNLEGGSRELRPEKMLDTEIGYSWTGRMLSGGLNLYAMEYWDMLLETGELSQSGYAIKDNVGRSYRRGVEAYLGFTPWDNLTLGGNVALSTNKILDYTQYWEEYDNLDDWNYLGQVSTHFDKVDMLMSPSVTAAAYARWTPFKHLRAGSLRTTTFGADFKYVGKQYWDNTAREERCIPSWYSLDISASHEFKLRHGSLGIAAYVKNVLGKLWYSDAWVYRAHFVEGDVWYQEEGVFPQAPTNFLVKIYYKL
ncbi:MAG: TonB-dependent receptor [Bacteroidales bacterium]|nr:TonB-dependent receptor [Bacteroidales bacterium]